MNNIILPFPSGPFETNAYIVACSKTKEAAIIDPAPGSKDLLISYLTEKGFRPTKILLTHSHWDHIADVAPLKAHYKIPVYIHPLDTPNLTSPGADRLPMMVRWESVTPDILCEENSLIEIGNLKLKVIHTPGHSPGSICFYEEKEGFLLSGDTLFQGTIGNISFPTSEPDKMWLSLKKLEALPPQTHVFPGHGQDTTIGAEKWLPNAKKLFEGDDS